MPNIIRKPYICINCGNGMQELFKKYSNSIKTMNCDKCKKVADKYIEFEYIIILVDAMLLSEHAFRHMIYNSDFKLNWKISLVLLLLESFTLWRKKRTNTELVHDRGFYICCLQNTFDYMITLILLLLITVICYWRSMVALKPDFRIFPITLLKAIAIANFSKFFLLPIMVWRENTTNIGSQIHHTLVLGHHIFSLIFIYAVVSGFNKLQSAFIILIIYFIKESLTNEVSKYMEIHF